MRRAGLRVFSGRAAVETLVAYAAIGWGVLQFASWAVDWWHLAPSLVDGLLVGWLVCLPLVIYLGARRRRPGAVVATGTPAAFARDASAASTGAANSPTADAQPSPGGEGTQPTAPDGAGAARSIAVLPFANLTQDPRDAFLSDGISDEILAALARVEGLRVASRTSTLAYRARELDVRAIGRELNVRCVLEGAVQRARERLRVTTRLVNAGDGYQLWSARYDRDMADVFAIEDEIAENVARVLRAIFRGAQGSAGAPPGPLTPVPRADVRAYEQYLRGRQFFYATRLKSLRFARDMFRRAVEIDPEYALAHAAVAETIALERMYYQAGDADLGEAERAGRRALDLDPELPEAHAALGCVFFLQKRLDDAEGEFRTALRLDPRCFDALYLYARMCFQSGRPEEAARLFAQAGEVREDYQAAFFVAQSEEALGHEERAAAAYRQALAIVETHMELNPDDPRAATMRAVALCRTGRQDEGLEWAERAVAIDPEDAGVRYNAACLFALAGRTERALDWLTQALRTGFGNLEWIRLDPDLASLRQHPRFQELTSTAMEDTQTPAQA